MSAVGEIDNDKTPPINTVAAHKTPKEKAKSNVAHLHWIIWLFHVENFTVILATSKIVFVGLFSLHYDTEFCHLTFGTLLM